MKRSGTDGQGRGPLDGKPNGPQPARQLSPVRLILFLGAALFLLGALHRPVIRGYRRLSAHVRRSSASVEDRAHDILANNPLIGADPLLFSYTKVSSFPWRCLRLS